MSFWTIALYTSATVNFAFGNLAIGAVSLGLAIAGNMYDLLDEGDEAPVPSPAPARRRD